MGTVGRIPSGAHEDLAAKKRADLFTDEVFLAPCRKVPYPENASQAGGGY